MKSQKPVSFFEGLYRRVGAGLGWTELPREGESIMARSESEIRDALLAVEEMGRFQRAQGKKGARHKDVRRWINESR